MILPRVALPLLRLTGTWLRRRVEARGHPLRGRGTPRAGQGAVIADVSQLTGVRRITMTRSAGAAWYRVLVMVLVMTGCSSHGVYPVEWGSLSRGEGDGCPSLAGVYWNAGERAVPAGGSPQYSPPYLSSYFFADTAAGARATRVRIRGDANAELTVAALGEGVSLAPRLLTQQVHYRCEDGWLLLESSRWMAEQVSGFESMTYRFRRTNDGAMAVQVSTSGVGVVFVVPIAGRSTEWHRFLPAE